MSERSLGQNNASSSDTSTPDTLFRSGTAFTTTISPGKTTSYPVRVTPPPDPTDRNIMICLLIERSHGDRSVFYDYDRVASAIEIALDTVNKDVLKNGFQFKTTYKDIGRTCLKKNDVVKYALQVLTSGVNCHAYLGPGCGYSADSLYNLVEYMQTPMMACPAAGFGTATSRDAYFMTTRTSFTHKDIVNVCLKLFDLYHYKHVTIIQDDAVSFYEQLSVTFTSVLRSARPDLFATANLVPLRSSDATTELYERILREGNATSRVFVICSNATVVRNLLIIAQHLGMTGGEYVYIGVELFDSQSWGKFTWSMGDSGDREAKQAFESLLLIALHQTRNEYYDLFSANLKKLARTRLNYTFGAFEEIDPVVTSFYDSIILYATIINQITASSPSSEAYNGVRIARMLKNLTFTSPVSGEVRIDPVGDRQFDFSIKSMNPDTGRFEIFYTYTAIGERMDKTGPLYWPTGALPQDTPRCGFQNENPECHPQVGLSGGMIAVAVVIPVIALLVICGLLVYFVIRSLKNEGLDPNWWKIAQHELDVTGPKGGSQGSRVASSKKSLGDDTTSVQTRQTDATSTMSNMAGRTATWKGNVVSVTDVAERKIRPNPFLIREMNQVRVISHQNLQRLLGVSIGEDGLCVYLVGELCQKGSLMDLLEKDSLKLDWSFKNSLIKDIVMGMAFLHGSAVESHGNLTAHTCLVDSRFMLKITDFGLTTFRDIRDLLPPAEDQDDRNFDLLLWRAPELMRQQMPPKGSQVGGRDVYSFGILLQQIILRSAPFDTPGDATKAHQSAKEHVMEIKKGMQPPQRPVVPASACSSELYNLMERCWDEYPIERPTFAKIKDGLKKVIGNSGDNIIDHLLKRMEQYANDLEAQVAEKTQQFMEEKRRSEELLSQLLPRSVAESLTRGQNVDPESYDSVTIYFSDIVGFTTISAAGTPMDVVSMLNNLYTMFDSILEKFDAYKVETIGDAYMVASGLPVRNGNRHASEIALVSLQIRKELDIFKIPHQPNDKLRLRIGVHSGSCVAGIVGLKMPRYCLFGDTVQIAMKMEQSGEPMKIQVTFAAKELLDDIGGFQMQERDRTVEFKNEEIRTFWLLSAK
ncbi:Atrial natriuretic peptide receptor 1 [Hypsibius exemplaris]|uniref:guanylate cyclase n=1 Tax=Hypsibius exemplaris TaxID=2072580 RepID=A0A9X6NMT1_HYPEX|nr:Atrial natriuretic peptide receptor 1 [Hypsibius exemplaris]